MFMHVLQHVTVIRASFRKDFVCFRPSSLTLPTITLQWIQEDPPYRLSCACSARPLTQFNEPEWPGEVKGVSVTFSLENQTVDISFDVETVGWYEIFEQAEIERLYRELVERIGPELTHNSEEWKCEHCGRAANEFQWLSVYTELEKMCRRGTIIRGQKALGESTVVNTIPRPDGLGPPSGACITCHKDPEAETELFIMSRCAKCKLVRYCGVACQKDDWSRHKAVCRKITKVSRGCNEKEKKVEIFSAADFFPDV
ncbi:hypothetical protein B0H16DRAFT_1452406 [Mycena metata]|uniref:MYND-type domain-containing protein n=1 Tax=Mycena metata TaxID=1033252 RepID=A0AAD7JQU6_9AGAR|nr:hypothetical protein B0H16DRAFT_1452406 [Mycena metata]